MKLIGKKYKELVQTLISAFPTKMSLTKMLQYQLSENLEIIVGNNHSSLEDVTFKVVQKFEAEDRILDLVQSARKENPHNQALQNLRVF